MDWDSLPQGEGVNEQKDLGRERDGSPSNAAGVIMASEAHTPAPWRRVDRRERSSTVEVEGGNGAAVITNHDYEGQYITEEDVAHAIACVNAHDELVAALRRIADLGEANGWNGGECATEARAALRMSATDSQMTTAGCVGVQTETMANPEGKA